MDPAASLRVPTDLDAYIERLPVGVYRTTPGGRIVMANPALAALLGYPSVDDLARVNVRDLYVHPEHRDRLFTRTAAGTDLTRVEVELRRADGERIWARSTARAIRDERGATLFLEGILEDVTEAHRTRRRLEASEERFRTAFLNAPIGMAIADPHFDAIRANPALLEMLGRARTLHGLDDVLDPADAADARRRAAAMRAGELDAYRVERRIRRTDGTFRWVHFHVSAVRDGTGRVSTIISQAVDVTERRRNEQRLRTLARSKDELVRSVSHELRTPLTTIVGLAAELHERDGEFTPSERGELLALIARQGEEMADLVDDLLAAARDEVGEVRMRIEDVDARAEVLAVAEAWRDRAVAVEVPEVPCPIRADAFRLRQIVRNLLANAVKYGSDPIVLRLVADTGGCHVLVEDGGPPLPESEWEAIFEKYYRAAPDPGLPGSIGLGLTLSRRLARLMGGDLTYRGVGGRSVFRLTLPRVA